MSLGEYQRRLHVEAAAGRGLRIECCAVGGGAWVTKTHLPWDWKRFDYRVAEPVYGKRTKAELLDQINALNAELQALDAQP